jgi:pyrroloquinoline quinone biosynthesis protein B
VYATKAVWDGFTENNVLFRTLERFEGQIRWTPLKLDIQQPLLNKSGEPSGLEVQAVAVPGKLPIHLGHRHASTEDNVALRITEVLTGKVLAYVPAVAAPTPDVERVTNHADVVFFDGTFWSSDELIQQQLGDKRAEDMAHWPLGSSDGSLAWLRHLSSQRRILIHLNNTNPVLREDSPEHRAVLDAGVSVAHDGMNLCL